MGRSNDDVVVTLTLAEAGALMGASGHGVEPSTNAQFAALDRAIEKIEHAQEITRSRPGRRVKRRRK